MNRYKFVSPTSKVSFRRRTEGHNESYGHKINKVSGRQRQYRHGMDRRPAVGDYNAMIKQQATQDWYTDQSHYKAQ